MPSTAAGAKKGFWGHIGKIAWKQNMKSPSRQSVAGWTHPERKDKTRSQNWKKRRNHGCYSLVILRLFCSTDQKWFLFPACFKENNLTFATLILEAKVISFFSCLLANQAGCNSRKGLRLLFSPTSGYGSTWAFQVSAMKDKGGFLGFHEPREALGHQDLLNNLFLKGKISLKTTAWAILGLLCFLLSVCLAVGAVTFVPMFMYVGEQLWVWLGVL